jgi:hypothetical protein
MATDPPPDIDPDLEAALLERLTTAARQAEHLVELGAGEAPFLEAALLELIDAGATVTIRRHPLLLGLVDVDVRIGTLGVGTQAADLPTALAIAAGATGVHR